MKDKVIIVGAGLVGSLLACYLGKRGLKVEVYEKRPDPRKGLRTQGRSINLALSNRGLRSLEEVGLGEKVREILIPMHGRMIHNEEGLLDFQPYGRLGQYINSVSRANLNTMLLEKAEELGTKFIFEHSCTGINWQENVVTFDHQGKESRIGGALIVGTDGAFSSVRSELMKTDRFNYSQHYIEHGYKELTISPNADGGFMMEKNALHIWPRGNFMLIALPNTDASFTCTLFFPFEGSQSFASLDSDEAVRKFFQHNFADACELIPDLVEQYNTNPTASLVTVRCYPWVKERVVIMGDASHAIVPFYGQGMNSGFEDVRVFNGLIDTNGPGWESVLSKFQTIRKPDADAIAELAMKNFVEMRDQVADSRFILRKKIESELNQKYPEQWIPQYSMVTFHDGIRYSEALRLGRIQDTIMNEFMDQFSEKTWEENDLEQIIAQYELKKAADH